MIALLVYFGGGYYVYYRIAKVDPPAANTLENNPSSFKVLHSEYPAFDRVSFEMSSYEKITFPSRQANITLSGWYVEVDPNAPAVIITHGVGGSKRSSSVLIPAGMLAHNGFNVLIFDMRNYGDSDKDNGYVGNKGYQDVLGAWDYLIRIKGYQASHVGLYGISLGGEATLVAFGQEPRVAAVFVDSPFTNIPETIKGLLIRHHLPTFLETPVILMARIINGDNLLDYDPDDAINNDKGRPIFIVHGTGDTQVSVNQTHEVLALADKKGLNVSVWMPDGIEHVQAMFALTSQYKQKLVSFFKTTLK
jgi:dipeptidyl aminopeptidase/acylaminoacyl peptidase